MDSCVAVSRCRSEFFCSADSRGCRHSDMHSRHLFTFLAELLFIIIVAVAETILLLPILMLISVPRRFVLWRDGRQIWIFENRQLKQGLNLFEAVKSKQNGKKLSR